jgi:hypothetical protein
MAVLVLQGLIQGAGGLRTGQSFFIKIQLEDIAAGFADDLLFGSTKGILRNS